MGIKDEHTKAVNHVVENKMGAIQSTLVTGIEQIIDDRKARLKDKKTENKEKKMIIFNLIADFYI